MWVSRNALRNRRFGNYCENYAQEEAKLTEIPQEPLPLRVLSADRVWWFQTSLLFDPNAKTGATQSERAQAPGVKCVPPLPCSVVDQGSSH